MNTRSRDLTQLPCMSCAGRGYDNCMTCRGAGATMISKSRMRYDRTLEFYQDRVPCTGCFGSGRMMCVFCKGAGSVLQSGSAPASQRRDVAVSFQPQDVPVSTPEVRPAGGRQVPQEFQFRAYEVVRHPDREEVWAMWQHNPGNCLDLGWSVSGSMRIELTGCQRDTWLAIQDNSGGPVPLSIFLDSRAGLLGRWL